jgi:hypothetical protein
MRLHLAAGRRRKAEIAIGGVGAQALIEIFLAQMADGEELFRPAFDGFGFWLRLLRRFPVL